MDHSCTWVCEITDTKTFYYCEICGKFTETRPKEYMEPVQEESTTEAETCRHVWTCLRDRCHNRGNGKYGAYKCKLCGKFQRR
jgi:hypothetical protein